MAVAVGLAVVVPSITFAARVLTTNGLGPVRLGMTVRELKHALGTRLSFEYASASDSDACFYAFRADGEDPGISYMFEDRHLVRIDIDYPRRGADRAHVVTERGFGLGSQQREILRAYARHVAIKPHPYLEDEGSYLIIESPDQKRGIIFETDHGKVTEFRVGIYPPLGYIEGCN